jgi:hypothetical protein
MVDQKDPIRAVIWKPGGFQYVIWEEDIGAREC